MAKKRKNKKPKHKNPQQHPTPQQVQQAVLETPEQSKTISERKLEANRQNAQFSTGAKTPEGKAKVSENAGRHWLTSKRVLLPHEDPQEYHAFVDAMLDELAPFTFLEFRVAVRIINHHWILRRFDTYTVDVHKTVPDICERLEKLNLAKRYERAVRRDLKADQEYFDHLKRNRCFDVIEAERLEREKKARETGEPVDITDLVATAFRVIRHTVAVKQWQVFLNEPAQHSLFGFVSSGPPQTRVA